MKSFAKLSLLLALVVTGRFLRPSTSTVSVTATTTSSAIPKPDALQFTFFNSPQASETVPVNRRTNPTKEQADSESTVWF